MNRHRVFALASIVFCHVPKSSDKRLVLLARERRHQPDSEQQQQQQQTERCWRPQSRTHSTRSISATCSDVHHMHPAELTLFPTKKRRSLPSSAEETPTFLTRSPLDGPPAEQIKRNCIPVNLTLKPDSLFTEGPLYAAASHSTSTSQWACRFALGVSPFNCYSVSGASRSCGAPPGR